LIAHHFRCRNTGNDARSGRLARCALVQAELDQAMARGRGRLADDLIAEGLRVLEEGPLRKDELGSRDVLSERAQAETEPAEP
jgi:hypothetical protein